MPGFSVLMANYNNGVFIAEAIDSVLAQTFIDWELIIVDDASTDNSLAQIRKYSSDNRIRLFVKERHEGVTAAQIYGLRKVSSQIVGILDSDDALMPMAIERVLSIYSKRKDVGAVLTSLAMCDALLKNPVYQKLDAHDLNKPLMWQSRGAHFRSFRLAAYHQTAGLDTRFRRSQDWDLLFKLEEITTIYFLDEPVYLQRFRVSSQTQGFLNEQHARVDFGRAFCDAYFRRRKRRKVNKVDNVPKLAVSAWLATATRLSLRLGRRLDALYFAFQAMRIAPLCVSSIGSFVEALRSSFLGKPFIEPIFGPSDRQKLLAIRTFLGGFESNTGNVEPDRIRCIPLIHRPGHALYGGQGFILQTGRYRVTFELKLEAYAFSQDPVVVLDIYENLQTNTILARREIQRVEVKDSISLFALDFEALEGFNIEFRAYWNGECLLDILGVLLELLTA
jgi:glycosyltransferase involved in cell wall biosynthesis